jgi:hypothetical protein
MRHSKFEGEDEPYPGLTFIVQRKYPEHWQQQRYAIHGQIYLWGTVVEHELGYRAQFSYPKNFVLSPDGLAFTLAEIRPRLQAVTLYGSDIFVLGNGGLFLYGARVQALSQPDSNTLSRWARILVFAASKTEF